MEGQNYMVLWIVAGAVAIAAAAVSAILIFIKRTAYLNPVKRELKKEKQWLRRGEYNAAMVKGRQNLELLFKLVAHNNGIQLDNTAQAVANAKSQQEKNGGRGDRRGRGRVMTHQQFIWWLEENGYLDRVAKWEMNEVRLIGNKAVHENYSSKEDAWNQYNYLEDILKMISEKHPGHGRKKGKKENSGADRGQGKTGGNKEKEKQKSRKDGAGKQKKQNVKSQNGEASKQKVEKKKEKQQRPQAPEKKEKQQKSQIPEKKEKQQKAQAPKKKEKQQKAQAPQTPEIPAASTEASDPEKKKTRRRRRGGKKHKTSGQERPTTELRIGVPVQTISQPQAPDGRTEMKNPETSAKKTDNAGTGKDTGAKAGTHRRRRRPHRRRPSSGTPNSQTAGDSRGSETPAGTAAASSAAAAEA